MLSTYMDSKPVAVSHDGVEVITSDGHRVVLSKATASLSDAWAKGSEEEVLHVTVPSHTLKDLVEAADALVARFFSPRPAAEVQSALEILRRLSLPRRFAVLRAAIVLEFRTVARMAATAISEVLRGRSAEVLRVVLDAADDMTAEERSAAISEPLLTPPSADDDGEIHGSRGGGGGGSASGDQSVDGGNDHSLDSDAACWAICLSELDARSLRTLKAVSREWRARARRVLGDEASAWRRHPEWSAGSWAAEWFLPRLSAEDEMRRKCALLALDSLEAAVELPQFLPELLPCLSAESRSSHRALALRALSRMETPTLELYGSTIREALEHNLEPHEVDSTQTRTLMAKLGMLAADDHRDGNDEESGAAVSEAAEADAAAARVIQQAERPAQSSKRTRQDSTDGEPKRQRLSANDLRRKLRRGVDGLERSRWANDGQAW